MASVHDLLISDAGIKFARKRIAEGLADLARNREAELTEKQARLGRIEARIANLVDVLASGERSEAISNAFRDMEAHAAAERRAIADLDRLATDPIRLPTPDEVIARFKWVEALLERAQLSDARRRPEERRRRHQRCARRQVARRQLPERDARGTAQAGAQGRLLVTSKVGVLSRRPIDLR
jgi:hypothetical protein